MLYEVITVAEPGPLGARDVARREVERPLVEPPLVHRAREPRRVRHQEPLDDGAVGGLGDGFRGEAAGPDSYNFV